MRAVRYERYGPPDVLQVHKVPVPRPGKGEVLIRVYATSVNPAEAQVRAGAYLSDQRGSNEHYEGSCSAGLHVAGLYFYGSGELMVARGKGNLLDVVR